MYDSLRTLAKSAVFTLKERVIQTPFSELLSLLLMDSQARETMLSADRHKNSGVLNRASLRRECQIILKSISCVKIMLVIHLLFNLSPNRQEMEGTNI